MLMKQIMLDTNIFDKLITDEYFPEVWQAAAGSIQLVTCEIQEQEIASIKDQKTAADCQYSQAGCSADYPACEQRQAQGRSNHSPYCSKLLRPICYRRQEAAGVVYPAVS